MSQEFSPIRNYPIVVEDSPNLDAFNRLRVSQPASLFSVQCQYAVPSLTMESGATGTGVSASHDSNHRMVKLSATAGSGTSFIQSMQYLMYQPGRSQLISITGDLDTAVAGAVVDVGYFDLDNGIFYRQNGTNGLQLVRRTKTSGSVVDNVVNQADWNLDRLDGTGTSTITLDPTKVFILMIDLQYLGMGRVRVGFNIDGKTTIVHEFNNANILTVPYMQTATLPVQMLLTATATGSTKNCYFKCANVSSEAGLTDDFALKFSTPEIAITAGNETRTHAISLRPKLTFNGFTNRTLFKIESISLVVLGANPVRWELAIGQAITSPSWTDVNTTYSAYEYGTGTISGSPTISTVAGYVQGSAQNKDSLAQDINSRYPISLSRAGAVRANGTISLLVTGLTGTSAIRASLNFEEIR